MISNKIYQFHHKIICSTKSSLYITLVKAFFYLLSLPYFIASKIRSFGYKKKIFKIYKVNKPVVSIGNISVGGTGKTPFCLELIKLCLQKNLLPALISRGYGNDESKIYQNRFPQIPMLFSGNRVKASKKLIEDHPSLSVIILDDAYQHQKIHRNINILLVNAMDPYGHHFCLPRGFLRESLTAINRADLVILTHADEINTFEKESIASKILFYAGKKIPISEATHEPDYLLSPNGEKTSFSSFNAKYQDKVAILSGIAHPEGFIKTLKKCDVSSIKHFIYPDHYQYLSNDFKIIAKERKYFDCLITTEKDIVKIPLETKRELNIYTLVMKMNISDPEKILDLIKEQIK